MSAVTPEGKPGEPHDRPVWVVALAVGISGVLLGYLLGTAGVPGDTDAIADTTSTTSTTTVPTTTTASPASAAGRRPIGTDGLPLAELIPGLQGRLIVEIGTWRDSDLLVWSDRLSVPRLATSRGLFAYVPDASGSWIAARGDSAGDLGGFAGALYAGRTYPLRPMALGVHTFAWHQTHPGRLAWIQRAASSESLELWVAEIDDLGRSIAPTRIMALDPEEILGAEPALVWDDHGFMISGYDRAVEEPFVAFLDPGGAERWRLPKHAHSVSIAAGAVLIITYESAAGYTSILSTDIADEPRPVDWSSREVSRGLLSPDGERIALIARETRLELRTLDGVLLAESGLDHRVWHADWSPDGRFIVAAGDRLSMGNVPSVIAIDTTDMELYEIIFNDWVQSAYVRLP